MEFQTLNEDFQAEHVVENYETLIWTERYSTNGEFQATFNNIPAGLAQLPEGSYVTLRESTVPMIRRTVFVIVFYEGVPTLVIATIYIPLY